MIAPELRFILQLFFNYLVGFAVANGWADPNSKDVLVHSLVESVGLLIIGVTSAIGTYRLYKVARHTPVNHVHPSSPVVNQSGLSNSLFVKTEETFHDETGTPLSVSPTEQTVQQTDPTATKNTVTE